MTQSHFQVLGVVSAIVTAGALIPYYIDIIRGRTKPHAPAYIIFGLLATISFISQFHAGARASLWFAGVLVANAWLLAALGLKYRLGKFTKRDVRSLCAAVIILGVWLFTGSPGLAIILVVVVNTVGKYLIMRKAYEHPYSELPIAWVLSTLGSAIAVASVGRLDWILLLSPIQNTITVGMISAIIIQRRRVVATPTAQKR